MALYFSPSWASRVVSVAPFIAYGYPDEIQRKSAGRGAG
jgi:hypothetical protein